MYQGLLATPILLSFILHHQEATRSTTTISVFATLALLLLVVIYCSNASTVHHYFTLVENERDLCFGNGIRRLSQERLHSYGVRRTYLVVLFALCGVESRAGSSSHAAERSGTQEEEVEVEVIPIEVWEASET